MDTVQETGPLLRFNGWNDVWVGIEFREKIEYLALTEPVTYILYSRASIQNEK